MRQREEHPTICRLGILGFLDDAVSLPATTGAIHWSSGCRSVFRGARDAIYIVWREDGSSHCLLVSRQSSIYGPIWCAEVGRTQDVI
jgi:hypothetical protein